jgi:hypothetical protein
VLSQFLAQADLVLPPDLSFRAQVYGDDSGMPDLVGFDAEARPVVIIEAKFWAGLTEHQPVSYIDRLTEHADAVLVFLAPAKRFPILWAELRQRCQTAAKPAAPSRQVASEFQSVDVGGLRRLALVSWRSLLSYLKRALEAERQFDSVADLAQLEGLCARMDDEAFLPLRSEELTGNIGLRVYQFCQLVSTVAKACVTQGFADTGNLRPAGGSAGGGVTSGCPVGAVSSTSIPTFGDLSVPLPYG